PCRWGRSPARRCPLAPLNTCSGKLLVLLPQPVRASCRLQRLVGPADGHTSTLVAIVFRHAQGKSQTPQYFFDLTEGFPPEVFSLEQFCFGLRDEFCKCVDMGIL